MGDVGYLRLVVEALRAPRHTVFGGMLRFDLRRGAMPLLTIKKMDWQLVVDNLACAVAGASNSEPDPSPGFYWRHYGAKYRGRGQDHGDEGFDQLQMCIDMLRESPSSRRILMSTWNPSDIQPAPCDALCQWLVDGDRLACMVYQRSCDIGEDLPYTIARYGLLTHAMAHMTGLHADQLILTFGAANIRHEHESELRALINKSPNPYPVVRLSGSCMQTAVEGAELLGYMPLPSFAEQQLRRP